MIAATTNPTPADGVDLTRLLGNLAELVRLLAEVSTLEELLETAAEHVRAGLGSATVSFTRIELGTGTLRTLINVGDLETRLSAKEPDATAARYLRAASRQTDNLAPREARIAILSDFIAAAS